MKLAVQESQQFLIAGLFGQFPNLPRFRVVSQLPTVRTNNSLYLGLVGIVVLRGLRFHFGFEICNVQQFCAFRNLFFSCHEVPLLTERLTDVGLYSRTVKSGVKVPRFILFISDGVKNRAQFRPPLV